MYACMHGWVALRYLDLLYLSTPGIPPCVPPCVSCLMSTQNFIKTNWRYQSVWWHKIQKRPGSNTALILLMAVLLCHLCLLITNSGHPVLNDLDSGKYQNIFREFCNSGTYQTYRSRQYWYVRTRIIVPVSNPFGKFGKIKHTLTLPFIQ